MFLFKILQQFRGNMLFDSMMVFLAEALVLAVPAVLVYMWFQGKQGRKDSVYVFIGVIATLFLSYTLLGTAIQHESPYQTFDTIASGEPENSFPSQHTATILATVPVLYWLKRRKMASILLGLGTVTGISRIYIGEHYLVDILGSGLAAVLGFTVIWSLDRTINDKLEKFINFCYSIQRKIFSYIPYEIEEKLNRQKK